MPLDVTTIGPLTHATRDDLREFKAENDLDNYNETIRTLLENARD